MDSFRVFRKHKIGVPGNIKFNFPQTSQYLQLEVHFFSSSSELNKTSQQTHGFHLWPRPASHAKHQGSIPWGSGVPGLH